MGNCSYTLLELGKYIEENGLCEGNAPTDMKGWVEMVQKNIDKNGTEVCPYSAEEIVDVLVATCMASINPVNDKTKKINKLIVEYCLKWSEMNINGQFVRPPYVMNAGKSKPSWEIRKHPIALTDSAEKEIREALANDEIKKNKKKADELTEEKKKQLLEDFIIKQEKAATEEAIKNAEKALGKLTAKETKTVKTTKNMRHKYIFSSILENAQNNVTEKVEFTYNKSQITVEFEISVSGQATAGKSKTDVENKEAKYTITKNITELKLVNDSSLKDSLFVLIDKENEGSPKVKKIRVTDKDGKELPGLSPDFKNGSLVEIADLGERVWRFDKAEKKSITRLNLVQGKGSLFYGNSYLSKRYEEANYNHWKDQWDESEEDGGKKSSVLTLLEKSQKSCKEKRDRNPLRNYQDYTGASIGKSHPDVIKYFLENFYGSHTDSEMVSVLENFSIGIDCSGFVTRAIAYVMENMDYEFSDDDKKRTEANLKVQYKTLWLLSGKRIKDDKDFEKYYRLLTEGKECLNNGAPKLKFYCDNPNDTSNDYVYKVSYKTESKKSKTLVRVYDNKEIIDTKYANKSEIDDDPESNEVMGSRLIYRFYQGKLDRINKFINPEDDPQITSLRPGDIITMSDSESFDRDGGFHIVLICDVGYDIEGPFFITADSSPSTLKESLKKIEDRKKGNVYSILKRPDSKEPITKEELDENKVKANQRGTGVRYILHRDLQYFNNKKYLAFRRPYVFDLLYRNIKFGASIVNSNIDQEN